jgi:transposase
LSRGDLSEAEWRLLEPLLRPQRGRKSRPAFDNRQIVNGILWRLRTGAPWRDLPEKYGKWMTVYQRFRRWNGMVHEERHDIPRASRGKKLLFRLNGTKSSSGGHRAG